MGCEIEIESNESSVGAASLNSINYGMGYMLIEADQELSVATSVWCGRLATNSPRKVLKSSTRASQLPFQSMS